MAQPDVAAVEALVRGDHGDPFALLGPHTNRAGTTVRAFLPHASRAWLVDDGAVSELNRVHGDGVFEARLKGKGPSAYRLRQQVGERTVEFDDPYRFPPVLGELDVHLIAQGDHRRLYGVLGAHPREMAGVRGTAFAVWAPNARRVSVVGDFNGWDGRVHPMRKRVEVGVWELFLPGVEPGTPYKFEVKDQHGNLMPLKADPFAFRAEHPPRTASVVHGLPRFEWSDAHWLEARRRANERDAPISIYECHLGSWMRSPEEGNRYLTYRELADRLVPYVREMGFTHVEFLPVSEYPFDGSWGYQPIGLYAPTSRHGSPEDFAALIDRCHREGIGVLVDWVPGHFPTDPHGLGTFDGTHLYEHADPRLGYHLDWNTLIYNYGRTEVRNFLLANGLFWLDQYHLDGLRVDAVASMLYLDYSRPADQWVPNRFGGRENLDAIDFLKRLNELTYEHHPGIATIAEESTAWPSVSRPTYLGGLGFGYKWNMGWMHDSLHYISRDPVYRRYDHHNLTFGLLYAFSENFVLPISHDEVVHGKGSLLNKMPGDRWQKFANLRAYYGFMFTHPGKKLLFMGCEFGQEREWNHDASLDWHLLDDPMHKGLQTLVRDLNAAYRGLPALHQLDCEPEGFEWLVGNDSDQSVVAYLRRGRDDRERIAVAACNFTPVPRHGYRFGVPHPGWYAERVNTDAALYGGANIGNAGGVHAEPIPWGGHPYSVSLTLPPLATLVLERHAG